jgi:protoporphyrinogen/coproporphyrinogen III oxidase
MFDVAIIGAGINGLTCGYYLHRAGLKIAVIEGAQFGGAMQTHRVGPYLLEAGPNSLRGNSPELLQLINDLGLQDQLIESSPYAKKRYLYRSDKLIATPSSPIEALTTALIPFSEKLKLLREPFVASTKASDESILDFVSRRISPWFAENIIDPVITGIYAGDIRKLSVRSSFPKMWDFEQQHGSIIKGTIKNRRKSASKPSKGIFSFSSGIHTLIDAIRLALDVSVVEGYPVSHLEHTENGYHLAGPNLEAKRVVVATPAHKAADLIEPLDASLAAQLNSIEHPHVAVVSLAFKRADVQHPLDGFGYLVPGNQQRNILGCIFSSSLWHGRAPQDEVLLTIMVGGSRHPEMHDWTDEQIIEVAEREVRTTLTITGSPVFRHVTRWHKAIPQYHLGHYRIMESIDSFERANPNLHLLSNYRGGIAIGSCVTYATELAKRLVQQHTN